MSFIIYFISSGGVFIIKVLNWCIVVVVSFLLKLVLVVMLTNGGIAVVLVGLADGSGVTEGDNC